MSAVPHSSYCTPEEYLHGESSSRDKHEWLDGRVIAMAGGSLNHSIITSNLNRLIGNWLVGKPCRVVDSNMRVRAESAKLYTYPDVTVFCGQPQFDPIDRSTGSITNPTLIIEVLSPATERYDRNEKFRRYLSIPSLREYVLVAQHEPYIEVRTPRNDGSWLVTPYSPLSATVRFACIEIEIPLAEVYAGVEFVPEE